MLQGQGQDQSFPHRMDKAFISPTAAHPPALNRQRSGFGVILRIGAVILHFVRCALWGIMFPFISATFFGDDPVQVTTNGHTRMMHIMTEIANGNPDIPKSVVRLAFIPTWLYIGLAALDMLVVIFSLIICFRASRQLNVITGSLTISAMVAMIGFIYYILQSVYVIVVGALFAALVVFLNFALFMPLDDQMLEKMRPFYYTKPLQGGCVEIQPYSTFNTQP